MTQDIFISIVTERANSNEMDFSSFNFLYR